MSLLCLKGVPLPSPTISSVLPEQLLIRWRQHGAAGTAMEAGTPKPQHHRERQASACPEALPFVPDNKRLPFVDDINANANANANAISTPIQPQSNAETQRAEEHTRTRRSRPPRTRRAEPDRRRRERCHCADPPLPSLGVSIGTKRGVIKMTSLRRPRLSIHTETSTDGRVGRSRVAVSPTASGAFTCRRATAVPSSPAVETQNPTWRRRWAGGGLTSSLA